MTRAPDSSTMATVASLTESVWAPAASVLAEQAWPRGQAPLYTVFAVGQAVSAWAMGTPAPVMQLEGLGVMAGAGAVGLTAACTSGGFCVSSDGRSRIT